MKKQKSNIWKWLLLILAILGIVIAASAKKMGYWGKPELKKIAVEKAEKRTLIETVSANGKIYPEVELKLSPDVSGEIVDLNISEGDSVKKGQLLARINPDIYTSIEERAKASVNISKSSVAGAESQMQQSQAQIQQIQAQLQNAQQTHQRNLQLFADKVISKAELELSETNLATIKAQLNAANAALSAAQKNIEGSGYNVQSAEAGLKESRDNLRKTNIYAPINGVVSKLNVEKGERVVGTSQFAGTEMLRIANFAMMEVRVDVSENDIIRVNIGDTALVEVDAYIDRKFNGIVTQIASSANSPSIASTDQMTNFTVKIRLLPTSYADLLTKQSIPFRPGMSASVEIITKRIENALSIPIQSVTVREDTTTLNKKVAPKDNKPQEIVFVIKNDTAYIRKVSTGSQDENYIEIKQGLQANEEVVSAPYSAISKELTDSLAINKVTMDKLFKKENK